MADDVFDYWFKWYPRRFKKRTLHLTIIQRAIYRELIDFYMETRSPLPDSDIALARIVGISVEEFAQNSAAIRPFFRVKKQGKNTLLLHPTCEGVLRDQDELSEKRKEKAKKAIKTRWEKNKENQGGEYSENTQAILGDTRGEERRGEESKGEERKKDQTQTLPSGKRPPLPPKAKTGSGSGSFSKVGEVVVGSGQGFDVRNHLQDDDYLWVRDYVHAAWDRRTVFEKYNAWASADPPKKPREAFLAWLKRNHKWLGRAP